MRHAIFETGKAASYRRRFQSTGRMRYDCLDLATEPPRCARRGDVMATSDNKTADTDEKIFIGKGEQAAWLTLALANRHGLVTGATGTGKTVSLQVMAEGFARAGVPVFAADIKGDLSGISEVGEAKDFIVKRAGEMGLELPARPVLDGVLGRVRRAGPPGPRHRHRNGAAAAVADARSERRPGGRAQRRIPRRGRERPDADRHEGSPRAAGRDRPGRPARRARMPRKTRWRRSAKPRRASATSPRPPSEPFSASFWCWRTRAERNSSASRR